MVRLIAVLVPVMIVALVIVGVLLYRRMETRVGQRKALANQVASQQRLIEQIMMDAEATAMVENNLFADRVLRLTRKETNQIESSY